MEIETKIGIPELIRRSDGDPCIRAVMKVRSDTCFAFLVLKDLLESDSPDLPAGLPDEVVTAARIGWDFYLGLGGRAQLSDLRRDARRLPFSRAA